MIGRRERAASRATDDSRAQPAGGGVEKEDTVGSGSSLRVSSSGPEALLPEELGL